MKTITERIDAVTRITADYMTTETPHPRSCKIELTATCPYHCNFCVKSIRKEAGDMDRELYSRLIREVRRAGTAELGVFLIGESFSCKWLAEAIWEAKHEVEFPYVFLTTNGALATPERVKECMQAGLDSLKFSMNFSSPEQLASIANVKPAQWRVAVDNIKSARRVRDEGGYKCGLYASSIKFDGAQGEQMQALVDEILPYVDEHYWLPLYGMTGASKEAGWKPTPGNPGRLDALRPPLPCWSVFTEAHITKDGLLAACCFGKGIEGDLVMADLKEVGFMEGWNNEAFRKLRAAHLMKDVSQTPCAGCISA